MANVPVVAKAENVAVDGTTAVHHRPPTAGLPHTAAHIQAGMQAGGYCCSVLRCELLGTAGSLQEVVLVVKAFDHECVIYPLGVAARAHSSCSTCCHCLRMAAPPSSLLLPPTLLLLSVGLLLLPTPLLPFCLLIDGCCLPCCCCHLQQLFIEVLCRS